MRPFRWLHLVLAAGLALGACSGSQKPKKSPEEQLVESREELRGTFDRLYRSYGGSEVAGGGTSGSGGVLGHVVGEADRAYLERQCLAVGRGERPISVSPKLQEFLGRPEVAKDCRRANEVQRHILELEKQVAGR